MTILGKHTVDETRHLMNTVEFRLERVKPIFDGIPSSVIVANPDTYEDLRKDWAAFRDRWAGARGVVLDRIFIIKIGQPLVPADILPAEGEYNIVKRAINKSGDETYGKGDLMDLILRTERMSNQILNEKDHPVPEGWDPDVEGYKKVDTAIKQGEAAATAASGAVSGVAKSNVGLIVAGVVVTGIAGIVVAKVYL